MGAVKYQVIFFPRVSSRVLPQENRGFYFVGIKSNLRQSATIVVFVLSVKHDRNLLFTS